MIEDGVTGSNGRLEGQLIAPDQPNPTDSVLIGNATYVLDNLGSGGGEHLVMQVHLATLSHLGRRGLQLKSRPHWVFSDMEIT